MVKVQARLKYYNIGVMTQKDEVSRGDKRITEYTNTLFDNSVEEKHRSLTFKWSAVSVSWPTVGNFSLGVEFSESELKEVTRRLKEVLN